MTRINIAAEGVRAYPEKVNGQAYHYDTELEVPTNRGELEITIKYDRLRLNFRDYLMEYRIPEVVVGDSPRIDPDEWEQTNYGMFYGPEAGPEMEWSEEEETFWLYVFGAWDRNNERDMGVVVEVKIGEDEVELFIP